MRTYKNKSLNDVDTMKTLSHKIRKNEYSYSLICRGCRSCLYAQHITPEIDCYEVFLIKVQKAKILFGNVIPEKEVFPSNEDFGKTAWSYSDYNTALNKYNNLESQ